MSVSKPVMPTEQDGSSGSPVTKRIAGVSIFDVITSFAKKISTVAIVYLLGYCNWSAAWLVAPVIYAVIREEWRKEKEMKRLIAKSAALADEKDVILARVGDLPSWVFFPDIERAEWLNKIMKQVWPNVNHYAKTIIKETIEPAVAASLATYKLSGFQFQKMNLGAIPPRIGGIKVYDKNVSRNEILMDIDLNYAGDCDISFTLAGISGGIKDFQIHGMVRVVMKPLISVIPMVGGLQIFFLNNPSIDFNLVGMADVLDMPGLSDLLRRIIVEQVAAIMVLPNKLPIMLSDAVPASALKVREPEGVLRVHVIEAEKLMKKDIGMLGKGKSDPYAIITVGAQEFRTPIIDNTVDPKWNYWCEFKVEALMGQLLVLRLLDYDNTGKDENLGRATLEISSVAQKGKLDSWISLEDAKHGMVHVECTWLALTSDSSELHTSLAETQKLRDRGRGMSSALLNIFVDSARNLPNARVQSKPDPFVTITLNQETRKTLTQWRTDHPVFEQGFVLLVHNPEVDTMHLRVTDFKTGRDIGELVYNLRQLLEKPGMTLESHPFALKGSGPEAKIVLTMSMRILRHGTRRPPVTPPPSPTESAPPMAPLSDMKTRAVEELLAAEAIKQEPAVTAETNTPSSSGTMKRGGSIHSVSSGRSDAGLGRILMSFAYNASNQKLQITVHKVEKIPLNDPSNIPDPYVKLYLLPERNKESKRRTEQVKDNCNPVYDQVFEYVIMSSELVTRQLEISVCTRKGIFSSQANCIGQVLVNLGELNFEEGTTEWFDLVPEFHKDKDE